MIVFSRNKDAFVLCFSFVSHSHQGHPIHLVAIAAILASHTNCPLKDDNLTLCFPEKIRNGSPSKDITVHVLAGPDKKKRGRGCLDRDTKHTFLCLCKNGHFLLQLT